MRCRSEAPTSTARVNQPRSFSETTNASRFVSLISLPLLSRNRTVEGTNATLITYGAIVGGERGKFNGYVEDISRGLAERLIRLVQELLDPATQVFFEGQTGWAASVSWGTLPGITSRS